MYILNTLLLPDDARSISREILYLYLHQIKEIKLKLLVTLFLFELYTHISIWYLLCQERAKTTKNNQKQPKIIQNKLKLFKTS